MKNWLIVIPARLQSTRLPEKPLQDLGGKPLIVRVYENLKPLEKNGISAIVATDSKKVTKICDEYNIPSILTKEDHPSGTDRVFEVSQKQNYPFILNVQGDEPFILLKDLTNLMEKFESSQFAMGTLAFRSNNKEHWIDQNVVKVVTTPSGKALYFSRASIPAVAHGEDTNNITFLQHMGIYAYRRETLEKICKLPQSNLEKKERLEQLRALENNIDILVVEAKKHSPGIDTPEDLKAAHDLL